MSANLPLLDTTLGLVRNRGKLTLREVAFGADVDFEWLSKFARGAIGDPGVQKVQRVHDYLSALPPAADVSHDGVPEERRVSG